MVLTISVILTIYLTHISAEDIRTREISNFAPFIIVAASPFLNELSLSARITGLLALFITLFAANLIADIGMGDVNAPILINTLNELRKNFSYADGDRPIYFIHAIRYLCACQKDRSSDLLKNIMMKSFAMGFVPEIPDFALDKHTVRGAEMGRDSFHFLNEASKVIPQMEVDNDYKERYAKILETYKPEEAVDSAFKFNPWQE